MQGNTAQWMPGAESAAVTLSIARYCFRFLVIYLLKGVNSQMADAPIHIKT